MISNLCLATILGVQCNEESCMEAEQLFSECKNTMATIKVRERLKVKVNTIVYFLRDVDFS